MNKLEQLRNMTTVVADTGDLEAITRLRPTDATTNPSLLLKAAALREFADEVGALKASQDTVADKVDRFAVSVGSRINQAIPGVISTEVDARLSFDAEATIAKAEKLIGLYADAGIGADRVPSSSRIGSSGTASVVVHGAVDASRWTRSPVGESTSGTV